MRLIIVFLLLSFLGFSQNDIVSWKLSETQGSIELKFEIKEGWRIYAHTVDSELGPVPTNVFMKTASCNDLNWIYPTPKNKFDESFQAEVEYWNGSGIIKSKLNCSTRNMVIEVEYMACNNQICLPPSVVELRLE